MQSDKPEGESRSDNDMNEYMEDGSDKASTNRNDNYDINEVLSSSFKSMSYLLCVSHTAQLTLQDDLNEFNQAKISSDFTAVVAFFKSLFQFWQTMDSY